MKNRSRPFPCAIAGKTVGVSLRHGGGLQEPARVYVRCDERDCQYVDLNEAPCPLRVDMFADGSDRRVADHLIAHAPARFCYACLTERLGITHDQVRRASWRLKDEEGFAIGPSRCGACQRRRVTIALQRGTVASAQAQALSAPDASAVGATPPLEAFLRAHPGYAFCAHCLAREVGCQPAVARETIGTLEPQGDFEIRTAQCVSCLLSKPVIRYKESTSEVEAPRRIIELLLKSPEMAFCASCIAFSTDLPLGEVRRVLHPIEPVADFERREGECGSCGRWQLVIRFRDGEAAAEHVAEVGAVLSGQIRHRGFRVDLLSFRTAEGWRPFALVKSALGALVPDAPPIVLATMPTKLEADECAAAAAREWIDKRWA